MSNHRSNLRSWFSRRGGDSPSLDAIEDTLEHRLESDESLAYHVPGGSGVVREAGETVEEIEPAEDGGSFAAVTDRKLLFAVASTNGEVVIELPHIDIRRVEVDDGFLKTVVTITVWDDGTYRFEPANTDRLPEITEYIDTVSDSWQTVDTLLDEIHVKTSEVSDHVKSGELAEATEVLDATEGTIREARAQIRAADLEPILGSRIDDAERELQRTRMRARLARATTLATEAKHLTDSRAYTEAFQRYYRAREHLDTALSIADDYGFEEPPIIQSGRETMTQRLENLRVRPMALAKQARERAEMTDHTDDEAEAWADAFTHYRDALTAGWGTEFEFATDEHDLRDLIEQSVENLIRSRQEYADELEAVGDADRSDDNREKAAYRYEGALEQLESAQDLAREFRAGDEEQIEWKLAQVREKLDATS